MDNAPVSIVLLTYNRPDYLPRMLDSVLSQKFRDFELILIDNGSTDGMTDKLCHVYAGKDSRIRHFSIEENRGPARARNLGIERSGGKYLIQLDDDDYCEPEHLSLLYNLIVKYDADLAISGCSDEICGQVIPKYDYAGVYVWNNQEVVSEFLKREKFHTAPATKLYRKTMYDNVRYVPGMIVDDTHVTYRLIAHVKKAAAHGVSTYRFCKHEDNTTSFLDKDMVWPELLDEYIDMQHDRVEYISKLVPKEAAHARYAAWSYMISMVEKINTGRGKGCEKQLRYFVNELRNNSREFMYASWFTERERLLMEQYVLPVAGKE
jgi:glycosyltransferase involved in cell wall biosynthesis